MNPKEFYEKKLPETKGTKFVLGLFSGESKDLFENEIKTLIENKEDGVSYKSYLNQGPGINVIDNILDDIQNASIIITDVSGFQPNVMYELGIALIKNDKHILIADNLSSSQLPFYLKNMQIYSYDLDKLSELQSFISKRLDELMPEAQHQCSFKQEVNDEVAQIKKMMKDRFYQPALILCEQLKRNDADNFCVEELWAEVLTAANHKDDNDNKLDLARKKYEEILQYPDISKSVKATVYMSIGNVFLKYASKRIDEALTSFSQSETFYSKNDELYDAWAYAFYLKKNYAKAYEKIEIARGLNKQSKDYILKSQYFHKRVIDQGYTEALGKFIKGKRGGKGPTKVPGTGRPKYELFKEKCALGRTIRAKVIAIKPAGIEFLTMEIVKNVKGFIHVNNITQNNFNAIFREGDLVEIKYTGNNEQWKQIFGREIKKINKR